MTCSSNDLLYFKWGNYKKKGGYLHLIKQAFNQHWFVNCFPKYGTLIHSLCQIVRFDFGLLPIISLILSQAQM